MQSVELKGLRALNAVCPYFTMFPIEFPLSVLRREPRGLVVDPFCGRGTTNLAARSLGLPTIGVDSSPVAFAATIGKLPRYGVEPSNVVRLASKIIGSKRKPSIPDDEFWRYAYNPEVLRKLCLLRDELCERCTTDNARALRAVILGALHGPKRASGDSSYFSNQCPRTFAPKPRYAVRFWERNRMLPPSVDLLGIIKERSERAFSAQQRVSQAKVKLADSRSVGWQKAIGSMGPIEWVITSPPYYGLRTYRQDQWLREWFLGGQSNVQYGVEGQISHASLQQFANDLALVWRKLAELSSTKARLVFRFGAINDRPINVTALALQSLEQTGWKVSTICSAGRADEGRRQAESFSQTICPPIKELDIWCTRQ
jgi:hypothetical protein